MACKFLQWILAGAGPTSLQHGLVGVGCLLAYDAVTRWRKRNQPKQSVEVETTEESPQQEYRRAA
jgi:hypothetical protein